MKKLGLYFGMLMLLICSYTSASAQNPGFYTSVTQLLQHHVQQGLVNYKSLRQEQAELEELVRQVAAYDVSTASVAEKKAFYLNAYNLLVLHQVLANYPLHSVTEVEGFFDRQKYKVAGQSITLNQLEKQKLLAPYQDARIHFALVCAAKSCPPLLNEAYTPERVEQQLEEQAKRTLQSQAFIRVQPKNKRVLVSEIFKWYKDDFLKAAPSIRAYINRYRNLPLPASYKLGYYTYDWRLNQLQE
ncbi:DUF547 domain-containing protein [Pontibacter anaerobius]|uniref:DUF547 domain-containing protein n=1 Tax=Pontibacter anaerobius TaxID=2993940 RepID=A0ABT3RHQ0_9BACT|nr:DUF547 domain-containing protein [Pontibacter anaerobius]MCX2741132.1 DUF547 domain-containing protein [Pontibacter anaerobius]